MSELYLVWTAKKWANNTYSRRALPANPSDLNARPSRWSCNRPPNQRSIGKRNRSRDESLYAALDHMLVKGWLTTEGVMSENNRKVQIYRVSGDGVTQLKGEDLRSWSARSKKRF